VPRTRPVPHTGQMPHTGQVTVHRYRVTASWTGSTGAGYQEYGRTHEVTVTSSGERLALSADPAFCGDPALANPEILLVAAASSCQLLSFLAVAARSRVDVVAYEDDAEAMMPEDDRPVRITEINLRPRITVCSPVTETRVLHLVEVALRECYIANSLTSKISVAPEITIVPKSPSCRNHHRAESPSW
jgi:organic hydroperoxide reductase OsmC/OhrA